MIDELTRILIIDDDENLLTSLCDILEYKGFKTLHANDGASALKIIEEQSLDVALVDLRLEDMSGLDLIKQIKNQSPFTECILLTGYATQTSAIEAISLGAFGYYQKPFEIDQVLLAIQQASAKSKNARALAASERRLRALIENNRDQIAVISEEGILLWASPKITEHWGFDVAEHDDIKTSVMIHPEEKGSLLFTLQEIAQTPNGKKDLVFRLMKNTGEWRWVEGTAVNLLDDPAVRGVVINFRDITEQKQAQDNLRLHDSALEVAANAIVIANREGTIIWVNQAFESLTGYTRSEAIGQNPRLLKSGFQNILFYEEMWNAILEGKPWHNELLNKRKDGSHYHEEMMITPLLDVNGDVEYFIAIKQDVSERKKFELNLAASEARYLSLFEDSPVAIKEEDYSLVKENLDRLSKRGIKNWAAYFKRHPEVVNELASLVKINDVNRATLRLHQASSKEFFREGLKKVFPDESSSSFIKELTHFAEGKTYFWIETVNQSLDGKPLDVEVHFSVPPGFEATLSKVIVSVVDISERKKHEKAIQQRNQELDLLYTAGRKLSQTLDLNKIYQSFYALVSSMMRCDMIRINEFDPDTKLIRTKFVASAGIPLDVSNFPPVQFEPDGQGIQDPVIKSGRARVINDYWGQLIHGISHDSAGSKTGHSEKLLPESPYTRSALVIPIVLNRSVRGTVQIQSFEKDSFTQDNLNLAEALVSQIALAMNNASLYQQSLEELEARVKAEKELLKKNLLQEKIVALGRALAASLDLSVLYRIAYRHIKTMIQCPNFAISLFDHEENKLTPVYISSDNRIIDHSEIPPLDFKLNQVVEGRARAIATRLPVIMTNLEENRKKTGGLLLGSEREPQSAIYIPMLAEDRVIGMIDLQSYQPDTYSPEMIDWITVVANQVGLAIQNARLHADILRDLIEKQKAEAEIRQSLNELELLYRNALIVNQLMDPSEIGKAIVDLLSKQYPDHYMVIRMREKESEILNLVGFYSPGETIKSREMTERKYKHMIKRVGDGLSGWVVSTGLTARYGDVRTAEHYIETDPGIRSGLYVPIKSGTSVIGSILLESKELDKYTERDEKLVQTIANQAAIAFENANLYRAVQEELLVRKITESALRESQGRLQSILDHASALVYIKDLKGHYTLVNKAFMKTFNLKSEQILSGRLADSCPYPEMPSHTKNDQFVLQKKLPKTFEEQLSLNGKTSVYLSVKFPIWNDRDELIGVCGISTDITEQKASEEQIKLLSHTVEQSPASVIITDPDGNIEYVNKKFTEATGYELSEVLGQNPRVLKSGHSSMEEYQKLWETIKAGGEWRGEFYTRKKDGTFFWESALISPILNNENAITHFLAVKEDITARKQAELELVQWNQQLEERVERRTLALNDANIQLEKASRLKDEFLASMSHELRTPLTGVLGLSEALQKGVYGDVSEKQVTILHTIEEGGRHLLNLINDILDLSKIEAGKMELQPNIVSVEEICQASLRLVKQIASSRRQRVSFKQTPMDMLVYADSKRMKQILVNLLGNAVKFTPDEGELGLEVIGDETKDEISFTVWDMGIGISAEDREKLFQPFVQIDSSLSRTYGGTGLGLSLVDRLARLHQGRVTFESEVGKGSRFTVTIPWHHEKVNLSNTMDQALLTIENQKKEEPKEDLGLGSVLIVEDNAVTQKMLTDYLQFNGYKVICSDNGQEGLALLKSRKPDIVLMDIQIPGIDGLQVIRTIRNLGGKVSSVPIIALTALAMQEDRQRCLDAGANEYMSKPVNLIGLLNLIRKLKVD